MKKTLYILGAIILLVVIAGIIKFNFINNDVYVPNGKGGYVNEYGKTAEFIDDVYLPEKKEEHANDYNKKTKSTDEKSKERDESWILELKKEYGVSVKQAGNTFILSEEVDFPEDCIGEEKFNKDESTCYITCTGKEDCLAKENALDDEFAKEFADWESAQKDFAKDFTELEVDADEVIENIQVEYRIEPTEKFVVVKGKEKESYQKIRKWLSTISPDDFSNRFLKKLVIYSDKNSEGLASVEEERGKPNNWVMYVNIEALNEEGDDKETVFTLVHEFAHILTLNSTQLDASFLEDDDAECDNYLIPEGCLKNNSYLNTFYNKFWKDKFDPMAESEMDNYEKNPKAFVDEYAATNPGEDIAETFASFVFQKKPATASTIAEQKINFFYNYPEFRNIRNSIRNQLVKFVRNRIKQ